MERWPFATLAPALALALATAAAAAQSPCQGLQREAVLQQVNALRAVGAVCGSRGGQAASAALVWSERLQGMAQQQARWMADFGLLIHVGRDGETLTQRAQAADYRFARIGENLAHGQTGVAQALAGWTASEGHCVNLYDQGVTEMALACVPGRDGRPFWVLMVGRLL